MKKTFQVRIASDGAIRLPFDPAAVFGKVRAPVKVTLNGYTYRSTVASMGDGPFVPLRRSHREAAGLADGATTAITLELDTDKREVTPPADLVQALKAGAAWDRWQALSFTHQREHVEAIEGAKQAATRARRIGNCVTMVRAMPEKTKPVTQAAKQQAAKQPTAPAAKQPTAPAAKQPAAKQKPTAKSVKPTKSRAR